MPTYPSSFIAGRYTDDGIVLFNNGVDILVNHVGTVMGTDVATRREVDDRLLIVIVGI